MASDDNTCFGKFERFPGERFAKECVYGPRSCDPSLGRLSPDAADLSRGVAERKIREELSRDGNALVVRRVPDLHRGGLGGLAGGDGGDLGHDGRDGAESSHFDGVG